MRRLASTIGRPVTFGMTQSNASPDQYRELLAEAAAAAAEGALVVPQVAGRASGLLFGLDTTYHPFSGRPSFERARRAAGRGEAGPVAPTRGPGGHPGGVRCVAGRLAARAL